MSTKDRNRLYQEALALCEANKDKITIVPYGLSLENDANSWGERDRKVLRKCAVAKMPLLSIAKLLCRQMRTVEAEIIRLGLKHDG